MSNTTMTYLNHVEEGFILMLEAIGVVCCLISTCAFKAFIYTFGWPFWLLSKLAAGRFRKQEAELLERFGAGETIGEIRGGENVKGK